MNEETPKPVGAQAVALLSGGLDSVLAARLIQDQGIEVVGVNFSGGYCPRPLKGKCNAEKAAEQLGIRLVELPIDQDFVDLVKVPRYGLGRNMNPCIDCHIMMVTKSWRWAEENGAQFCQRTGSVPFVVTGEVLGQRPMSQTKQGLMLVAKRSGTTGRLLRPLSAKLLEPTMPEKDGLVDRQRLLDIQGRSRRRQMDLARELGITEYATPAGGCLLTDVNFARRLREAFDRHEDSVAMLELLRLGRHFRLESGARLIVGRNKDENDELLRRVPDRTVVIDASRVPGPVCLLIPASAGRPVDSAPLADVDKAAAICARYSDRRRDPAVRVRVGEKEIEVAPADPEWVARLMIE